MRRAGSLAVVGVALIAAAAACSEDEPTFAREAVAPVHAAFGEPLPDLAPGIRARFEAGRAVAERRFFPSSGLGPEYNAVSCRNCHEKPTTGGGASRYRSVYVGAGAGETFIVPFEHHFTVDSISKARKGPSTAKRVPPAFFGMGLLAEISPEEIISRADPNDADQDGVSGKVNFERGFIGRFGRKAQMSSVQGFVRLALLDHLGVTSTPVVIDFLPGQGDVPVELPTRDNDSIPDPELSTDDLGNLLVFVSMLAPPVFDPLTEQTDKGSKNFEAIGCATCHTPRLRGPRGPIAAYSDLLLHDMGPDLADGVEVGEAKGSEFRTQPLWGLAAAGPFLHDGRADTVDEAIRMHGGEATNSLQRYNALTDEARANLLAFLRSLGGSDRRPDGLLANDQPLLPPDTIGGPVIGTDLARFTRGRDLFDRDMKRSEGLGTKFNGDACRSCHFDPAIGGAGPSDVDVIRYGLVIERNFTPPADSETLAPRFQLDPHRPALDPAANLFERRQTPAIFGLGLFDLVSDDTLRSFADPDDKDGDGIRGIVSVLPDGRLGRFGWKAQQATLSDFSRDAFDKELGLQISSELTEANFEDVMFFMRSLAPPPSRPLNEQEAKGRERFEAIGCATCHRASTPLTDGRSIAAYTDLLIHDVAPPTKPFVAQITARGFRTPPLWGIKASPPYLHDGTAETLDAAIRAHEGEAQSVKTRYESDDKEAIQAFLLAL